MTKHRITWISDVTGKATTRLFKTEAKARNEWGGIVNSRFTRYALWTEVSGDFTETVKGIRGEVHGKFYLNALR